MLQWQTFPCADSIVREAVGGGGLGGAGGVEEVRGEDVELVMVTVEGTEVEVGRAGGGVWAGRVGALVEVWMEV